MDIREEVPPYKVIISQDDEPVTITDRDEAFSHCIIAGGISVVDSRNITVFRN